MENQIQPTITKESIEKLVTEKHNPSLSKNGQHVNLLFGDGNLVSTKGGDLLFERSMFTVGTSITKEEIISMPIALSVTTTYAIVTEEDGKLIRGQMLELVQVKDLPDDHFVSILVGKYYPSIQDFRNGKKHPWLSEIEQKHIERQKYALTPEEKETLETLEQRKAKYNSFIFTEREEEIISEYSLPYDGPQLSASL